MNFNKKLSNHSLKQKLNTLLNCHRYQMPKDWDSSDQAVQARVERVLAGDFEFFVDTYFPHFVRNPHKSELHLYLFEVLPKIVQHSDGVKLATAAPRGEAKSTLVTRLYTLFRLVTGTLKYGIIVMDSIDQAYPMLDAIKTELESNQRLKSDFPNHTGQGRVWRASVILTKSEVKIEVAGAGKRLRGKVHGAYRPDYVVLDDIENDKNVQKVEQRDKLQNWLTATILPLGVVGEKLDIIYIGTILHYDSVLSRTLNSPAWQSKRFKAIITMPHNMALWDEWEALYAAKELAKADAFYQAHQDEMVKGSKVSWLARPLLDLMKIRAENRQSFDSEYQNDPTAGDDAPFSNAIHFWYRLPDDLLYFGACDPSLGKKGAGRDPSALTILGLDKHSGKCYIIESQIKKRLPDRIISDIIALQKTYQCYAWAIESVQFQEFLRTELVKRGQAQGVPIPAIAVKPTSDKLLRIESLQPYMKNEQLLLHANQHTLIDQFRHFPKADHDDGPDSVEMAFKLAMQAQRKTAAIALELPTPSRW